jgi:predicted alpha/beta superfamily hydrolase
LKVLLVVIELTRVHAAKRTIFNAMLLAVLGLLVGTHASAQEPLPYEAPERLVIKSQVLGEERVIFVRTPAGYTRSNDRFPVLYLTDGDAHIQQASATVAFLASNARMPEMIVVGITNTDRTRDLTPTHVAQLPNNPSLRFPTSGGADKFLKFVETELIPVVESKYRTQPYRVFAGHSLGGLFAVYTLITRPQLFNAYIAASPALQWDNFLLIGRVREFFETRKELGRTLFVSLAAEAGGIGSAFGQFRDVLGKQQVKGFVWEAVRFEDEDHFSAVMRSYYTGLRKVFDGWLYPIDPSTNLVAGGLKGVEEHYHKLSERLGFTVPPPEALMNQVGYQAMGQGNLEEAIAAFKLNVERHPDSANVYDSLGEAYERAGRLELALRSYEKAYALGLKTNDPNMKTFKANRDRVAAQVRPAGGVKR